MDPQAQFENWWQALTAEQRERLDKRSALVGYLAGICQGIEQAMEIAAKVVA